MTSRWSQFWIAVALLLACPLVAAQLLGPGEVAESVRRWYPVIEAAELERRAAEAQVTAARGAFDFRLRASVGTSPLGEYDETHGSFGFEQATPFWGTSLYGGYRQGQDFAVYDGNSTTSESGEIFGGIRVPLARDGRTDAARLGIRRAELESEVARADRDLARVQAVRAGIGAYWRWMAAGQKLQIARDLLAIAEERDAALGTQVVSGQVAPIERVDNQRIIATRRERVVAARRSFERAALQLSLYVRDSDGKPRVPQLAELPRRIPAPGSPRTHAAESDVQSALSRRPDLRALELSRRIEKAKLRWSRNQQAPTVDLDVKASRDFGSPRAYAPFADTSNETKVGVALSFEWPVQRRKARGEAAAARAKMGAIGRRLDFARESITAEIHDIHSQLRATYDRSVLARRALEASRQMEDAERERFFLGQSTLLLVNLREQAAAEAAMRVVDALAAYHDAEARLEAALAAEAQSERRSGAVRTVTE